MFLFDYRNRLKFIAHLILYVLIPTIMKGDYMKATQKAALALALTIASTGAFADTTNFEGLSIFGAASVVTNALKIKDDDGVLIEGAGKSTFSTSVGADYGLKLSDTAVVLLGGTYNLGSSSVYTVAGMDPNDGLQNGETKIKTQWSLYAAPGITFGNDVLLYGKLAYVSSKLSMDGAKTHPGMGYGAGARFALTKQVFLNVEFMRNEIGKKTYPDDDGTGSSDLSWSSTAGTVALGYRF
jgi:opacity protein-like surface antigen